MKTQHPFHIKKLFAVVLLICLLIPTLAHAQSPRVKLTVQNKSNHAFSLWLTGPEYIYFTVEPESTAVFTPLRGVYSYWMFSCQTYAEGELDITKQKTMIVPPCGSASPQKSDDNTVDVSEIIKIVKVTMDNDATSSNMIIVLTGPGTFVFSLKAGEEKSYTIPRGEYNVTYYACGRSGTTTFTARADKILELVCP